VTRSHRVTQFREGETLSGRFRLPGGRTASREGALARLAVWRKWAYSGQKRAEPAGLTESGAAKPVGGILLSSANSIVNYARVDLFLAMMDDMLA